MHTCSRSLIRGTRCITLAVRGEKATPGKSVSHSAQQRSQNRVMGTMPWGWKPSTYSPEVTHEGDGVRHKNNEALIFRKTVLKE